MSTRPVVTVGAIYTPLVWAHKGYTAHEQREYRDGTRVVLMHDKNGNERALAWHGPAGTTRGSLTRLVTSHADLSVIVREWRAVWRVLMVQRVAS